MIYWHNVLKEASAQASADLKFNSRVGVVTTLLSRNRFDGVRGDQIHTKQPLDAHRQRSRAVRLVAHPFCLLRPLGDQHQARRAGKESIDLQSQIAELEAEAQSDISSRLNPQSAVSADLSKSLSHAYFVIAENVGPNYLTNCILRQSTSTRLNLHFHEWSMMEDASRALDPRRPKRATSDPLDGC